MTIKGYVCDHGHIQQSLRILSRLCAIRGQGWGHSYLVSTSRNNLGDVTFSVSFYRLPEAKGAAALFCIPDFGLGETWAVSLLYSQPRLLQ